MNNYNLSDATQLWGHPLEVEQQQHADNSFMNNAGTNDSNNNFFGNPMLENHHQQQQHNQQQHPQHHQDVHEDDPYQPRRIKDTTATSTITTNLAFTTQDAAQRAVLEVLARHNENIGDHDDDDDDTVSEDDSDEDGAQEDRNKRHHHLTSGNSSNMAAMNKRQRISNDVVSHHHHLHHHDHIGDSFDDEEEDHGSLAEEEEEEKDEMKDLVEAGGETEEEEYVLPPSTVGVSSFNDNDVLCGRGGGTNVHPGNRQFRDLINLHRRAYLKARKNDKPEISRSIVRTIRSSDGRFLKKDNKSDLWFEIGDSMAREKTSQALRQRAPEMRKILFETEREQARQQQQELHHNQQRFFTGVNGATTTATGGGLNVPYVNHQQVHHQQVQYQPVMGGGGRSFANGGGCIGSMNSTNNTAPQSADPPLLNPYVAMNPNKKAFDTLQHGNEYQELSQNLMTAALLGGGINRITPHGA